jgi:Acetyltransferase (GNAT) domain
VLETYVHASDELQPFPNQEENGAVCRADPLNDARWDGLLAECGSATIFHSSAWARVLSGSYGFSPLYLVEGESGRTPSLLPIMEVDSRLTGRRGVSLPFSDECEPAAGDAAAFGRMFGEALRLGRERSWKYLEIRGGRPFLGQAPSSTSYFGHRLPLKAGESSLFGSLDSSTRTAIRKAEHGAVTIEFSREAGAVREFYRLLCKTRKRHGAPPQPFRFFLSVHREILEKSLGWVVLAKVAGRPVAGAVFFHSGGTATYKYGASDESFKHLRPNNLVMWEAIRRYSAEGYGVLDFGRTSLANEGLRRFKLSWGTEERTIEYFRYDLRRSRFVIVPDEASGWQARIFRLMPTSLARLVGAAAYKHLA